MVYKGKSHLEMDDLGVMLKLAVPKKWVRARGKVGQEAEEVLQAAQTRSLAKQ